MRHSAYRPGRRGCASGCSPSFPRAGSGGRCPNARTSHTSGVRAHIVPVAYVGGFVGGPGRPRQRPVWATFRDGQTRRQKVATVCHVRDYYSGRPELDSRLFRACEVSLANFYRSLDSGRWAPIDVECLWELKGRNRSILDMLRTSEERVRLMGAARHLDLGQERRQELVLAPEGSPLVTSDDPVVVASTSSAPEPDEYFLLLAIRSDMLLVDIPGSFENSSGGVLSEADVARFNKIQCEQARTYVLSASEPVDPDVLVRDMGDAPHEATSGFVADLTLMEGGPRTGRQPAILNFVSSKSPLDFMRLRS